MIRCDGGMSNDFSKWNGPCIFARLQALPARLLVRRLVASGLRPPIPAITHLQPTGTGMPGILSELSAPAWLDTNGLAHHACIGISIS